MGEALLTEEQVTDVARERDLLAVALRRSGYGRLADAPSSRALPDWAANIQDAAIVAGGGVGYFFALWAVGLAPGVAAAGAVALMALIFGIHKLEPPDTVWAVYVWMAAIVLGAAWVAVDVGWEVLLTHVLPLVATWLAVFVTDRFEAESLKSTAVAVKGVLKNLPLLFPLIALVLFALILTNEVWQTAGKQSLVHLGILSVFVIAPVIWLLRDELTGSVGKTFETASADVSELGDGRVAAVLERLHGSVTPADEAWLREHRIDSIEESFSGGGYVDVAKSICESLSRPVKRRITVRLILTMIAVGASAFVVIYLLTWLSVPEELAEKWTVVTEPKPGEEKQVIDYWDDLGPALPLGPYLRVTILLSILAVAVFFAFIITTDSLTSELRDAYIKEPATTALLLVIPYRAARDEAARPRDG